MPGTSLRVWDPFVRTCHWVLALAVLVAWLTRYGPDVWHEWAGYLAVAVAAARIFWGIRAPGHAAFSAFVRAPNATWRYARTVWLRCDARYIGHNPLGAWMILVLLTTVVLVVGSGWLYTTDRFWGVPWVDRLHSVLADALLVLVLLHVAGVVFASVRHRENLVWSMVTGRKRAPHIAD